MFSRRLKQERNKHGLLLSNGTGSDDQHKNRNLCVCVFGLLLLGTNSVFCVGLCLATKAIRILCLDSF
jgi:hypothetical protein